MNNKFGVRLKQLRKSKKLTQKELGEKFDMSDSAITLYEKGYRYPSVDVLLKLAAFFNVSMDYLIGRVDDPNIEVIQTNFLDNEGKKHDIQIEYKKDNQSDTISLQEIEELIRVSKKLGIDLNKITFNK